MINTEAEKEQQAAREALSLAEKELSRIKYTKYLHVLFGLLTSASSLGLLHVLLYRGYVWVDSILLGVSLLVVVVVSICNAYNTWKYYFLLKEGVLFFKKYIWGQDGK